MPADSPKSQKRKADDLDDTVVEEYLFVPPATPPEIRAKYQNFACFDENCAVEKFPYPQHNIFDTDFHYHRLLRTDGSEPLNGKRCKFLEGLLLFQNLILL